MIPRLRLTFDYYWSAPWMEKWGRLILLFLTCIPFFLWFNHHPSQQASNDQVVLVSIIFALAVGTVISTITTEKYYARSLGLYGIIVGSLIYYVYVLLYYRGENFPVLRDIVRSIYLVSSWLFATSSLVTWHQFRKKKTPTR
jgi:hypothetical protein